MYILRGYWREGIILSLEHTCCFGLAYVSFRVLSVWVSMLAYTVHMALEGTTRGGDEEETEEEAFYATAKLLLTSCQLL